MVNSVSNLGFKAAFMVYMNKDWRERLNDPKLELKLIATSINYPGKSETRQTNEFNRLSVVKKNAIKCKVMECMARNGKDDEALRLAKESVRFADYEPAFMRTGKDYKKAISTVINGLLKRDAKVYSAKEMGDLIENNPHALD